METKCGCVNCNPRNPKLAAKGELRNETHMDIYRRLSRIVIMHGPPGPPKPKHNGG